MLKRNEIERLRQAIVATIASPVIGSIERLGDRARDCKVILPIKQSWCGIKIKSNSLELELFLQKPFILRLSELDFRPSGMYGLSSQPCKIESIQNLPIAGLENRFSDRFA